MVHAFVMEAIEKTLKDWGVDWKLDSDYDGNDNFKTLMEELELALSRVIT